MAKIVEDTIVLVPQEVVDKDQAWFWKERSQRLEAEADRDVAEGRTKTVNSVEELFREIEGTAQAGPDRATTPEAFLAR